MVMFPTPEEMVAKSPPDSGSNSRDSAATANSAHSPMSPKYANKLGATECEGMTISEVGNGSYKFRCKFCYKFCWEGIIIRRHYNIIIAIKTTTNTTLQGEQIESITSINSATSDKVSEFSSKLTPVVER